LPLCWRNTSRHVRRHVWGHVVRRDAQPVDMVLHSFSWTETIYLLVFIVLRSLFVPLFLGYKIPAYFQRTKYRNFLASPPPFGFHILTHSMPRALCLCRSFPNLLRQNSLPPLTVLISSISFLRDVTMVYHAQMEHPSYRPIGTAVAPEIGQHPGGPDRNPFLGRTDGVRRRLIPPP
jgi:hypothetical protein